MSIQTVFVIGAGTMGRQIALNSAIHGKQVRITDAVKTILPEVRAWAEDYLAKRVAKGKMTQEAADGALARLQTVEGYEEGCRDADLVIEAIVEDEAIKGELFVELERYLREDAIIATNSSYIPSSKFAPLLKHPDGLANLHYFHPALAMKLTEVVQGEHTAENTIRALMEFSTETGKDPVWLHKEIDGFIANRILDAIANEAFSLWEKGIADPRDIDKACELGLNHPMGPFRVFDFSGIDVCYHSSMNTYKATGVKPAGHDLIEEMYKAGMLGVKSGEGFYKYDK